MPPQQSSAIDVAEQRLFELTEFERIACSRGFRAIAGVDEAGRGPLAGPVVASACIIPPDIFFPGINDSKQLSANQRACLFQQITSHPGVQYGVAIVSHEVIDRINILQASIQAMLEAVAALSLVPDYLLVDGLKLQHPNTPSEKIIKGDTKSQSIAAASIIAKVTRDALMEEYDREWPHYGFAKHKGYGTAKHYEAIRQHGPCRIHRLSFNLKLLYTERD